MNQRVCIRYPHYVTHYGFQTAPPLSGPAALAAGAADRTPSSSSAYDLDVVESAAVAHMERRGALVPPKMDIDDDPGGKREREREREKFLTQPM